MAKAKKSKILIIDPAMATPCQEAIECIHRIVKEFSTHPEFAFQNVEYFAPNFAKKNLSSFLKSLEIGSVISLGSFANITEKHSFADELSRDLQNEILPRNIPFLGICFSHQLLAHMYGFKVGFLKNRESVPGGRHYVFRSFNLLHPKLALLATQMLEKDYFSGNAFDLSFKEAVKITAFWDQKDWQNLSTLPDWMLTPQEFRIKKHIENHTAKNLTCQARHEQEVWDIPCSNNSSHLALGGTSSACQVEALVHTKYPAYTFQTHVETKHPSGGGYLILKNFLYMSSILST